MRGPRTAMKRGPHLPQLEPSHRNKDPTQQSINQSIKKKKKFKKLKKKKNHDEIPSHTYEDGVYQKSNKINNKCW